ncbi:MAG: SDR family oxidoreductase [Anaerolineaceae bacterium]|jgi:3-dehydrosphinganine reductase|nr:SDR family oxidoreductase [Anaerolineaceae bacterium]
MNTYKNKRILITGGSSGIGLALARQLSSLGASVHLLARSPERLQSSLKTIKEMRISPEQNFSAIQADVTDLETLAPALDQFEQAFGAPDIVINAAGVAHPGEFAELEIETFHWVMEINYFGTVNVIKLLLPAMRKRGSGHIINFSSIAGYMGVYGYTAYGASKYAVRGFSDALRAELKPKGIAVSVIFPPDTDTPQLAYEGPFKPPITKILSGNAKTMTADEVAAITLRQAAKQRYIITPGFESSLFFTLSSLLGRLIYPIMDMQITQAIKKLKHP